MTQAPKPKASASTVVAILVAMGLVIAFAYAFPEALHAYCGTHWSSPERSPSYSFHVQGNASIPNATNSKKPSSSTTPTPTIGAIEATGGAYPADDARHDPDSWWTKFWCDVTGSDYFIALFTLVLAISTLFLWLETRRLAHHSEIQLERMAESIAAMTAVATQTGELVRQSKRQADLARDEFNATHRPRIRVRTIYGPFENADGTTTFRVQIVNVGTQAANISEYQISAIDHDGTEGVGIELQRAIHTEDIWLPGGQTHVFETKTKNEWELDPDFNLIVVGEVTYAGSAGVEHHTGFARVYDAHRGSFTTSDIHADDEYED